jgi:hypothetical protein
MRGAFSRPRDVNRLGRRPRFGRRRERLAAARLVGNGFGLYGGGVCPGYSSGGIFRLSLKIPPVTHRDHSPPYKPKPLPTHRTATHALGACQKSGQRMEQPAGTYS